MLLFIFWAVMLDPHSWYVGQRLARNNKTGAFLPSRKPPLLPEGPAV